MAFDVLVPVEWRRCSDRSFDLLFPRVETDAGCEGEDDGSSYASSHAPDAVLFFDAPTLEPLTSPAKGCEAITSGL